MQMSENNAIHIGERQPIVFPDDAEVERSRAVSAKLRELALQHGLDMDHPEKWKAPEVALRNQLLDEAQGAIPNAKPQMAGPKEFQFDGDPLEGVQAAKQAHAEAVSALAAAQEVYDRALARMEKCEQDLQSHADLDAEIEAWTVRQLKENRTTDLSYAFKTRLTERAQAKDRFDIAKAAQAKLQRELATAQGTARQAERFVKAAASAYIMRQAEEMVEDLRRAEAAAVECRSILLSLGAAWLPGLHGAYPLPASIAAALNAPMATADIDPKAVTIWQQRHADVIALAELGEDQCLPA
jgi:hypothetical protein